MTAPSELSKEDLAWLIQALWKALKAPGWTRASRSDLEKLGEALYSGKDLQDLDERLFARLLPHLKASAQDLGISILKRQLNAEYGKARETVPAASNPETGESSSASQDSHTPSKE
jgi:hypothetical protein